MNSYYKDKLYPLQDKVLAHIDQLRTPLASQLEQAPILHINSAN